MTACDCELLGVLTLEHRCEMQAAGLSSSNPLGEQMLPEIPHPKREAGHSLGHELAGQECRIIPRSAGLFPEQLYLAHVFGNAAAAATGGSNDCQHGE